jgi:hypothetical protein
MSQEIKVETFSNAGKWDYPTINVESNSFIYSSPYENMYGLQLSEKLQSNKDQIKTLCDEISKNVYELFKLINK